MSIKRQAAILISAPVSKKRTLSIFMFDPETVIAKGNALRDRIYALSVDLETERHSQEKLVLSFDLYCILLEYSILVGQLHFDTDHKLEDFLFCDDLIFEVPPRRLQVVVDFFAPPNSMKIC